MKSTALSQTPLSYLADTSASESVKKVLRPAPLASLMGLTAGFPYHGARPTVRVAETPNALPKNKQEAIAKATVVEAQEKRARKAERQAWSFDRSRAHLEGWTLHKRGFILTLESKATQEEMDEANHNALLHVLVHAIAGSGYHDRAVRIHRLATSTRENEGVRRMVIAALTHHHGSVEATLAWLKARVDNHTKDTAPQEQTAHEPAAEDAAFSDPSQF